jgi:hypothetical protein
MNRQLVDEHTGAPTDGKAGGSSVVLLMVRDAYANYVVQTTLDVVAEGEEKQLLLEELNAHSAQLVSVGKANNCFAQLIECVPYHACVPTCSANIHLLSTL